MPNTSAVDLSAGNAFPLVTLPSINGGERVELKDHLGEKLMLHLFASW